MRRLLGIVAAWLMATALGACTVESGDDDDAPPNEPQLTLSCAKACEKVMNLCQGRAGYDQTWQDACRASCENKEHVQFERAKQETDCVNAAADCDTATACVSDL